MIIPTRRTILLGLVPLLLIAISGGMPAVIEVAWASLLVIIVAWLIDGSKAISTRRLLLHRNAPAQIHIGQSQPIEWIAENRTADPVVVELRDQLPEGCSADQRNRVVPGSRRIPAFDCFIISCRRSGEIWSSATCSFASRDGWAWPGGCSG